MLEAVHIWKYYHIGILKLHTHACQPQIKFKSEPRPQNERKRKYAPPPDAAQATENTFGESSAQNLVHNAHGVAAPGPSRA